MSGPDQVASTFDTAVAAFEILFERELDSKWRDLAGKTRDAILGEGLEIDAHPVEKFHLLGQFCDDASDAIAAVVKKDFLRLLEVATAQSEHLGGLSPLTWTEAKILTVVCNFLAMDEKVDETSTPRDSSLVLGTAERIITGGRYPDDGSSPEFRLPGWAKMTPRQLIGSLRLDSPVRNSTEPPLSRADTLEWVKWKEWMIRKGLERQISDTSFEASLDGMIEAGTNEPSKQLKTKFPHNAANLPPGTKQKKISFIKGKNGTKRSIPSSDPCDLVHTFDELWPLLAQVRTMVIKGKGKISAEKLEQEFKATYLGEAASIENYREFIGAFADLSTTPKNIALVFLEDTLARSRGSLKSSISRTRKQMNANNQRHLTSVNLR